MRSLSVSVTLVAAALLSVGCAAEDSTSTASAPTSTVAPSAQATTTTTALTTTGAPTTTVALTSTASSTSTDGGPIAARDALIEITYTGDGASYSGGQLIVEGSATFTFTNESDHGAAVGFFWYEPGSSALVEELGFLEEGERGVPTGLPAEPYVEIELEQHIDVEGNLVEPGTYTWTLDLEHGTYIFDAGPPDFHDTGLWRAAIIEVVPAGQG